LRANTSWRLYLSSRHQRYFILLFDGGILFSVFNFFIILLYFIRCLLYLLYLFIYSIGSECFELTSQDKNMVGSFIDGILQSTKGKNCFLHVDKESPRGEYNYNFQVCLSILFFFLFTLCSSFPITFIYPLFICFPIDLLILLDFFSRSLFFLFLHSLGRRICRE
jgi:hypothetical protein